MKLQEYIHRRTVKRRGVTLLEIMVAMGLLSTVFMAVAFIQSASAKQVRSLYGDARTLHRAHLVLDRIRYKLCMGEVGSPVVKDDGHTLEFVNPSLNGIVSSFKFFDNKVYYYENKEAAASTPGQGIGVVDEMTFQILGAGNAVRITVVTVQRFSWKLDRPFTLDTEVTLRN